MPDRYADAVRARRAELRAQLALLDRGHRAQLSGCLALSRLTARAEVSTALAELAMAARGYAERAGRADRARLAGLVARAVDGVAVGAHASWAAAVAPGVRRIATERALTLGPGWPRLPAPRLPALRVPVAGPAPALPGAVAEAAAAWRLALLPVAVLPLFGLPVLGPVAVAGLVLGTGLLVVALSVTARRAAAERAAALRVVEELLVAARGALELDLASRSVDLERTLGADLDVAVRRRGAELRAQLLLLAADALPGVRGG